MIPYLLGYQPLESLVVVALLPPRGRFGPVVRIDLGAADDVHQLADFLAATATHHDFREVLVVAFSDRAELAGLHLTACLGSFGEADIRVVDALRADGRRWWSFVCTDERCCPSSGTAYDSAATHPAAEAVLAGMSVLPSRESLADRFAPASASTRQKMGRQLRRLLERAEDADASEIVRERLPALVRACEVSSEEAAELAMAVQVVPARDEAWASMTRRTAEQHLEIWSRLAREVPDEFLAPVGSLAAFAAWLSGNGTLASHAVDRVLSVAPGYSMAKLIEEALIRVVDPRTWDAAAAARAAGASGDLDDPDEPLAG